MAVSGPRAFSMRDLKSKLLRPATTSNFECYFYPPPTVVTAMNAKASAGAGVQINSNTQETLTLNCFDASLPGSSLQTASLADSYTGVNENYVYRRAYDNRADFSFYVDHGTGGNGYKVIWFFENWISYIVNEQYSEGLKNGNYFYRINYPDDYMGEITILKFEKDFNRAAEKGRSLQYDFIAAYPISINSMPVSYEASQLLKCTVSFSYQRYVVKKGP